MYEENTQRHLKALSSQRRRGSSSQVSSMVVCFNYSLLLDKAEPLKTREKLPTVIRQ